MPSRLARTLAAPSTLALLACLASGLSIDETRWAFRQDDG